MIYAAQERTDGGALEEGTARAQEPSTLAAFSDMMMTQLACEKHEEFIIGRLRGCWVSSVPPLCLYYSVAMLTLRVATCRATNYGRNS